MIRIRPRPAWMAAALTAFALATPARGDAATHEPIEVPFDSPLNLILLEVRIGESDPIRFILDSGASNCLIDVETARRLGVALGSSASYGGAAAGSEVTITQIPDGLSLALGGEASVHLRGIVAAPLAKSALVMLGERVDGILGHEFFSSYTVEIDYERRVVTLHDPATFEYAGEGTEFALEFPERYPKLPFFRASLRNGERALDDLSVSIDSGGQTLSTIGLRSPEHWSAMVDSTSKILETKGATGLSNTPDGMTHPTFATRMTSFHMGPYEFATPLVSHSPGPLDFAVMGASLLHRFTVVFDYRRKRMLLEPNGRFDLPHETDRSGATIVANEDGRGLRVLYVAKETPAFAAGVQANDEILSIDGRPAAELPLNEARRLLSASATYRVRLARAGVELELEITTAPLL